MRNKTFISSVLIALFSFLAIVATGQEKKIISLVDRTTGNPIDGVYFHYSGQKGISDDNGRITIEYKAGENLYLNHLTYGSWILDDVQVQSAVKTGMTSREMISFDLQPVSIIALHPRTSEAREIELTYQDRQHHDAGAILSTDAAINPIRKSGVYGFDPVIRGFKYDQLNIVINGAQSASAACPNRMDPITSQVALNMTGHIDVLKGPYSLRFGNSFGGTVNFISLPPEFSTKYKTTGRISGTFESNGKVYRTEGYIGGSSRIVNMRLFGSWSQGGDYRDGNRKTVPSGFRRGSIGADLSVKPVNNQLLSFSVNRNFGRDVDFPALPMDLRSDDTWMINGQHEIAFTEKRLVSWKSMVYGTYVDHYMNNYMKVIDPRIVNTESPTNTITYGGRTEGNWLVKNSIIYLGGDIKVEKAEGKRIREFIAGPNKGKIFTDNSWQSSNITKSAVFFESQVNTRALVYVFAGRMELNRAQAGDMAEEFSAINNGHSTTQVNPQVSLGVLRKLDERANLKLWLGRSQRSGSITERFVNFFPVGQDPYELLGNPDIKPEVNNQADLIFELKTEKLFINADIFSSYLMNYISPVIDRAIKPRLPSSPGVRQFRNTGNALKNGFELTINQVLPAGLNHRLSLAYTHATDRDLKKPLPEISPFELRYRLSGSYFKKMFMPEAGIRYAARQSRISEEFGESITPSFFTMDIGIKAMISEEISMSGGIQNLFDGAYYEHLNRGISGDPAGRIYNPGRSGYISFMVDFK